MNISELRSLNIDKLKNDLLLLYREKLKLKLDKTSGSEFIKTHLIKCNRRKIARILTVISEKENCKKYE